MRLWQMSPAMRCDCVSVPIRGPRSAGRDTQSHRIAGLICDSLIERDAQMNPRGDLAERGDTPDALTYSFHLRRGVHSHDGRPLPSADVKDTSDPMLNGSLQTAKRGSLQRGASIRP